MWHANAWGMQTQGACKRMCLIYEHMTIDAPNWPHSATLRRLRSVNERLAFCIELLCELSFVRFLCIFGLLTIASASCYVPAPGIKRQCVCMCVQREIEVPSLAPLARLSRCIVCIAVLSQPCTSHPRSQEVG
jgi:hypothetical protein